MDELDASKLELATLHEQLTLDYPDFDVPPELIKRYVVLKQLSSRNITTLISEQDKALLRW
ncbi:MAG: hypothetical protein H6765_11400 [Candidatus Peribacteria bacterium]|nr:MAG: hypothetical protein H6765_11400 [Candidatus Peribacteria bacterium]